MRILSLLVMATLSILVLSISVNVLAYDEVYGIEWGDVVDISFTRYINGKFSIEYGPDNPFRVTVDDDITNIHLVEALLGMKIGETKKQISWSVTAENGTVFNYDYYNTTIIKIVKDSTPVKNITGAGRVFLIILEVLVAGGAVVGGVYLFLFLRKKVKIGIKKCVSCGNIATVKCSKCGTYYCANCSIHGCKNCKFPRDS